jgi:hypothetical protein
VNIDDVEEMVGALADSHACHTAILYGSWARGTATAGSDIDVVLVRHAGEAFRDARIFNGVYLDAFVYPETELTELKPELLRFLGGKVVREQGGSGHALLAKLQQLHDSGPPLMAEHERRAVLLWSRKMLERTAGDSRLEASYRRMQLLTQALEDYFALRGNWFRGPKEAFAWLLQHDPATYARFDCAARRDASDEMLAEVVSAVYGAPIDV